MVDESEEQFGDGLQIGLMIRWKSGKFRNCFDAKFLDQGF